MHYIVFDLEWNNPSNGRVIENEYGRLPYEIIEIGAVKADKNFNIVSSFNRIVRPQVYLKLNKAVEKVVPLTNRDLYRGKKFEAAAKDFFDWCGEDIVFCTWGDADLLNLQRNMAFFNVKREFPVPFLYLDLQRVYSEQFHDGIRMTCLSDAVEAFKINRTKAYHRAIADAEFTCKVAANLNPSIMDKRYSIDTYRIPSRASEEIHLVNEDMEQYVSKGFKSKIRAAENRELRSNRCFLCGETMNRDVRWFCDNNRNYYSAFYCYNHGNMVGKFKVKLSEDNFYYAVRTIRLSNEEGLFSIKERKQREVERARQARLRKELNEKNK